VFCWILAAGVPVGKVQLQDVGEFVAAPVNETASGAHPERGVAVILATGTCAYPL